jgi:uncharacterized NAD-dependent epimerase/dehydratase family protein
MSTFPEGNAIIYCQGAFGTPNGKTAHGLVRRTERYNVLSVVDVRHAGEDAGECLDGKTRNIPIYAGTAEAVEAARKQGKPASHWVMGLAPDGGRLSPESLEHVKEAVRLGLNVDSGLHDFLSEDDEIAALAREKGIQIRDVRKTPPRKDLHFFTGKIEQVSAVKVALLGTDSAVGKRTTAWLLADAFRALGLKAELIGTGQTAWMQGVRFGMIMDSLINDFVSGEIEHAVWTAWHESKPEVIIIEGQGSLMNPAYPGGFEILAAGRPDAVVLQHAPAREEYDGFPGYPLHPLETQIQAIEFLSGKPVVAVTVNSEKLVHDLIPAVCADITARTGLPAVEPLLNGVGPVVETLIPFLGRSRRTDR